MNTTRSPRRARTAPAAPPAPATESRPLLALGRDVNGRFRSGNPGGPGNPFARKVASLRKAMLESVSDDDVQQVIQAIKAKARQGDVAAAKLLLSYSVGRPAEPKDPDRMDIDEWQWLQQMRVSVKEFMDTVNSLPACLSSFLASIHWACNTQSNAVTPLAAGLARLDERDAAANGDAQPNGGRAPRQRAAPAANGRKKAGRRPKASDDATPPEYAPTPPPSTNGDTESNGRHEPPEQAEPGEHPSTAAPPATEAKKPAGRRKASGESSSAQRPPAPAPSANGDAQPDGRPETSEQAEPGAHPPAPPPSANGDTAAAEAAAADVLARLLGLLGQPPQDDRGPPRR